MVWSLQVACHGQHVACRIKTSLSISVEAQGPDGTTGHAMSFGSIFKSEKEDGLNLRLSWDCREFSLLISRF